MIIFVRVIRCHFSPYGEPNASRIRLVLVNHRDVSFCTSAFIVHYLCIIITGIIVAFSHQFVSLFFCDVCPEHPWFSTFLAWKFAVYFVNHVSIVIFFGHGVAGKKLSLGSFNHSESSFSLRFWRLRRSCSLSSSLSSSRHAPGRVKRSQSSFVMVRLFLMSWRIFAGFRLSRSGP